MLSTLQPYSTQNIIPSLLFFFLFLRDLACFVQAGIFIFADCSTEEYQPNSPSEASLNSFLSSVVSSASQKSYNSFSVGNGSSVLPEGTIHGLYQCRGDLNLPDCSKCIQSAVSQIGQVCPYSNGAALQLEGCYVRYEHVDFLGRLDTALMHKKCSRSVRNDVDFFHRRDDFLADMQAEAGVAGGFRVSSSGPVQGFAQCLGDLSSADCSSCLSDAVGKLKSLCGSAAAADVFLGKCYARYWASGYYDDSPADSSDEDVGKTVAIIIGTVAGLAIIIVLLSFCRKALCELSDL